jgi:hypothetical protein
MRILSAVLIACIAVAPALLQPAFAQETGAASRPRITWQQRFARANSTGDGHLTLEQAKAGYPTIARRFDEIDLDAKGYVTVEDIRSWHKARQEMHPQAKSTAENPLRPRSADQRMLPDPSRPATQVISTIPHTATPTATIQAEGTTPPEAGSPRSD